MKKMTITNCEPSQKYIKRNRYSKQSIFDREGTIERFSLGVCLAIASYFLIDTMNNNKLKLFWRNKCHQISRGSFFLFLVTILCHLPS